MSLIVVAVLPAQPGLASRILENFAEISPLVHDEAGCEFYAAHLDAARETVVIVERWTTRADLDAHGSGAPVTRLRALNAALLAAPEQVYITDAVPLGDAAKGVVPGLEG
jgi:quinol monooxygenase YgiN